MAQIESESLIDLVIAFGGIDEEGATNIIKGIFGISAEDPLPEGLPVHLRFAFTLADQ